MQEISVEDVMAIREGLVKSGTYVEPKYGEQVICVAIEMMKETPPIEPAMATSKALKYVHLVTGNHSKRKPMSTGGEDGLFTLNLVIDWLTLLAQEPAEMSAKLSKAHGNRSVPISLDVIHHKLLSCDDNDTLRLLVDQAMQYHFEWLKEGCENIQGRIETLVEALNVLKEGYGQ